MGQDETVQILVVVSGGLIKGVFCSNIVDAYVTVADLDSLEMSDGPDFNREYGSIEEMEDEIARMISEGELDAIY